ncbi:MAG: sugar phosphate isomerase/epimerase [Verrucomicrobiota bacterium]|nr:sugar phosphate isomerase/epimerase [Verrucomicrobiota bacterium]
MRKIGLQLYSVREELANNYEETIRKVADMGYTVLEPAGFPGSTMQKAIKLFNELNIKTESFHGALPIGDDKNQTIEQALALGAKYIGTGFGANEFKTADSIKECADKFNQATENIKKHGLKMVYHNHWWEMETVDGQIAYRIFKEAAVADVCFELDIYWIQTGGQNVVDVITEIGERAPVLHIKDGPCDKDLAMTAVGAGKVDIKAAVQASNADLLIVEMDRCDTDTLTAIKESYDYLNSII